MKAMKRKFNKLKGVSSQCDKFANENDRRPFVFGMTFSDGGTITSEGSVKKEDADQLTEIFKKLQSLANKD